MSEQAPAHGRPRARGGRVRLPQWAYASRPPARGRHRLNGGPATSATTARPEAGAPVVAAPTGGIHTSPGGVVAAPDGGTVPSPYATPQHGGFSAAPDGLVLPAEATTITAAPDDAPMLLGITALPDDDVRLQLITASPITALPITASPDSAPLTVGAPSEAPPVETPPPAPTISWFTAAPDDAAETAPFSAAPDTAHASIAMAPPTTVARASVAPVFEEHDIDTGALDHAFSAAPEVVEPAAPALAPARRPRQWPPVESRRRSRQRRRVLLSWSGLAVALAILATAVYYAKSENEPSQGTTRALVVGTTTTAGPSTAAGGTPDARAIPLGDYAGLADPAGVQAFAASTGTHPALATDYLDRNNGWAGLESATNVKAWARSGYRLVLGIPILPGTGTLAQGATGAYNTYFATLARTLVSEGEPTAILRLGWEFNGTWFRWNVRTAAQAAAFAAFWRQIVISMRSVPGEQFRFLWNPNAPSPTAYIPNAAYPGDGYVDYVGTDIYDNFWGRGAFTEPVAWAHQLSQQWGLDWLASFAADHHKPIAIPEWSDEFRTDGHGLGDDPDFIDHMARWFVDNNVAFADVWCYDSSRTYRNNLLDGTFPKALAEFKADFG